MAVAASPRAYPSASAEKLLHEPVGDRTPCSVRAIVIEGPRMRLTPPTRAASQLPLEIAMHASFKATRADEQAVRIVMLVYRLLY